ncbi:class I SAM-dependent methyltransferase [Amycolatopsis cihanbeyliensis]|uniref:Methyltransferase family protein n=1 Tax=Amycolatopsis cihanbeyliensis TaxID=1128664 RepID=A0A542CTZ6_AMYCI|nr:class I SAM-dependent methyltransferase [Amycolatopsis cihanbeyliensis]TQI94293.1 methyltransferase family protein [Amycolatopsis cihanbeyliensis]
MPQAMGWNDFVDTETREEYQRLNLLERIFDPFTVRNLDRLGVRPGSRCLEVGAGAGSVARHMAELAGPEYVTATDLSLAFLTPLTELGIQVRQHDVTADDPPGEFDLIHARFVLDHLREREAVLARMASWLRPGGWLCVEAASTLPELSSRPATRRSMETLSRVMSDRVGTHTTWARQLPLPLERVGLLDCDTEGQMLPARGGSPLASWLKSTTKLVESHALETGLITRHELDEAYVLYESPDFLDYSWLTIAAWGRRPTAG